MKQGNSEEENSCGLCNSSNHKCVICRKKVCNILHSVPLDNDNDLVRIHPKCQEETERGNQETQVVKPEINDSSQAQAEAEVTYLIPVIY